MEGKVNISYKIIMLLRIAILSNLIISSNIASANMKNEKNVLGSQLLLHSKYPATGFYRDGYCRTDSSDKGCHVVAAIVTKEFLEFTKSKGNDLETPNNISRFPGLKPGDKWCLCAIRWKEAYDAGVAPPVVLEATHKKALEYIPLKILKTFRK